VSLFEDSREAMRAFKDADSEAESFVVELICWSFNSRSALAVSREYQHRIWIAGSDENMAYPLSEGCREDWHFQRDSSQLNS
jgi:type IV pilus biogenesis protein CpaD/CtpE